MKWLKVAALVAWIAPGVWVLDEIRNEDRILRQKPSLKPWAGPLVIAVAPIGLALDYLCDYTDWDWPYDLGDLFAELIEA